MSHVHALSSVALAVSLGACASAPTEQLIESRSALRAAEEVGAPDDPRAAYHLELAEQQIEQAERLMEGNRRDREEAARLLDRAEIDAELALSKAKARQAEHEARRAWAEVNDLRQQTQ